MAVGEGRHDLVERQVVASADDVADLVRKGVGRGGTLVVNKIGGPAFNGSTVLNFFDQLNNQPDNTQPAVPQIVPSPGGGLVWDAQNMLTNLTLTVIQPPALTNDFSSGTNIVFSWSAQYRGWRLETLTNSLSVGLESSSTNWRTLVTTLGGTNVLYYPDITNFPTDFYVRSVQDIRLTNDTVFYRLAYP